MLAAAVVVTGVGLARVQVVSEAPGAPHLVGVVDSLDEVMRVLDREGIHAVHADYWIAYRLAFETDERIVGSPSAGSLRYPPYDDRGPPRRPGGLDRGHRLEPGAGDAAAARRAGRRLPRGAGRRASVVITDRNVQPEELPNEARTPEGWEMPPPPGESY